MNVICVDLSDFILNYELKIFRAVETNHSVKWSDFMYSINLGLA